MNARTFHFPANPVESHKVVSGHFWQMVKALGMAGHRSVAQLRTEEDVMTDKQRKYLHGYVLMTIARQAQVNGQKFDMRVWKEQFRSMFLGFKTVTHKNPLTGKKVRRRERVSTEDLGVKGYSEYIDRVTSFAAMELGVEFMSEWIDPDTGEVYMLADMKKHKPARKAEKQLEAA